MRSAKFIKYRALVVALMINSIASFSTTLRDPTEPLDASLIGGASDASGMFQLQSIIVSPTRILAMIDGQMVGVGSDIHGARVLAIGKNHVVLLQGGQKKTLFLFGKRLWKAR